MNEPSGNRFPKFYNTPPIRTMELIVPSSSFFYQVFNMGAVPLNCGKSGCHVIKIKILKIKKNYLRSGKFVKESRKTYLYK